jgi:hypothetical protein
MSHSREIPILLACAIVILCACALSAQTTAPGTAITSGSIADSARYPNTKDGLRTLVNDMLVATRHGDKQSVDALMKQTEFTDYAHYFVGTYSPDPLAAEDWAIVYQRWLGNNEGQLRGLLETLAKDENGRILVRKVNDDPLPGRGFEWGLLHDARIPIDVYCVTLVFGHSPENAAELSGYYVYWDGMFRWDSIVPFAKPGTYQSDPGKLDETQSSTVGSAQYANTSEGLQGFLGELLSAAKSGDQAQVASMIKQTEIPEYQNWFCRVYIPGSGLSWATPYGKNLAQNEQAFNVTLEKLAQNEDEIQVRKLVDKPGGHRGAEWGMIHNSRTALDIYYASLKSKTGAGDEWVGYFIYIDGMFRLQNSRLRIAVTRVSRSPSQ